MFGDEGGTFREDCYLIPHEGLRRYCFAKYNRSAEEDIFPDLLSLGGVVRQGAKQAGKRLVAVVARGGGRRVFDSADPAVARVANQLERQYPGYVKRVNVSMRNPATGNLVGEFDIVTRNAVIEVGMGGGKGKLSQIRKLQELTSKRVVAYLPNAGPLVVQELRRAGIPVARTPAELRRVLRLVRRS